MGVAIQENVVVRRKSIKSGSELEKQNSRLKTENSKRETGKTITDKERKRTEKFIVYLAKLSVVQTVKRRKIRRTIN